MNATLWLIITIVCFSLAGVALVASIILFFYFRIPSVIGDLTGRTVAKEVKAMRVANVDKNAQYHHSMSSSTPQRPSSAITNKGYEKRVEKTPKKTEKSVHVKPAAPVADISDIATDKLSDNSRAGVFAADAGDKKTDVLSEEPTDVLDGTAVLSDDTAVLSDDTAVLSDDTAVLSDDTVVLSDDTVVLSEDETVVLSEDETDNKKSLNGFSIVDDTTVIHTDEVIE